MLFTVPLKWHVLGFEEQPNLVGSKRVALVLSVMTNLIEMLLVSVIGVGVFILVVHSMLWETVLRYSERFEVKWLKRAMIAIGMALILGTALTHDNLRKIVLALVGE